MTEVNEGALLNFLKENKNKVVAITFNCSPTEGQIMYLSDFDDISLKLLNTRNHIVYIPISAILYINKPEYDEIEKFKDYCKKFKENPDFRGDSDLDKGYTIIRGKSRT